MDNYVFSNILKDDDCLNDITPLHSAAVKSNSFISKIKALTPITLSKSQNKKLVDLEKSLDLCVIHSRMMKTNENIYCNGAGNIYDRKTNINLVEKQKKKIDNFIDFPVYNFQNTFSGHWKNKDDNCKLNSFTYADAAHYTLNNVIYDFNEFKKRYGDKDDLGEKWDEYIDQLSNLKKVKGEPKKGDFVKIVGIKNYKYKGLYRKIENKYGTVKSYNKDSKEVIVELIDPMIINDVCIFPKINIKNLMVVKNHWYVDQKKYSNSKIERKFIESIEEDEDIPLMHYDIDDTNVIWEKKEIESTFGSITVKEVLNFDTRLLKKMRLDVPLICIPSILRKGSSDYHCVYFEDSNALGQLEDMKKNFATIVVVREEQKEEYVKRYKSDHTYFVALDQRTNVNIKGYSAGDSKFYCYRIAQYLYENYIKSKHKRVLIMDDQMQPFTHQIPYFEGNDTLRKNKKGSLIAKKDVFDKNNNIIINDTYKFRNNFFDKKNKLSMLFEGNCRTIITHATTLMYLNEVANITKAGLVCVSNNEAESVHTTLRTTPYKNWVWLLDLDICGKIRSIQSPIHPAFQAAEDTLLSNVLSSYDIPMVTCNTIRARKSVTGGGTCGRNVGKPKPYTPIIKYHELLKVTQFENINKYNFGKVNNKFYNKNMETRSVDEINNVGFPFKKVKIYSREKENKYATEYIEFIFENKTYHVKLNNFARSKHLNVVIGDTPAKWSHPYGSRHQINLMLLNTLKQILMDKKPKQKKLIAKTYNKFKSGDPVLAKWKTKLYIATIVEYDKKENAYNVKFKDGSWDYANENDIVPRFLRLEDVKVQWKDGKMYDAVVIEWDEKKQKYDVEFDDGSAGFISRKKIKKAEVSEVKKMEVKFKF